MKNKKSKILKFKPHLNTLVQIRIQCIQIYLKKTNYLLYNCYAFFSKIYLRKNKNVKSATRQQI